MSLDDVIGYVRVSGRDQIDGDGFGRQCAEIERWCARNGKRLVAVYMEKAVSGRKGLVDDDVDRPAFSDMVSAMLDKGASPLPIVVECLDRFARNLMIQTQLLGYLRGKGLTLISAMTGEDATAALDADKDPMRWAIVQIQGVFAELDRNLTVRKLRSGRERKRRETGMCEGRKPFGLDPKRPDEHPVREQIIELYRSGNPNDAIASALNLAGQRTRQGAMWTDRTVAKVVKKHRVIEGAKLCR